MQAIKQNPLGTESIVRLMIKFSVPAIMSFLVNALYNIVDQIFIGRGVGLNGIAATNVAFPLVTICTALALLLGVGSASNFNLSLGAGDKERAGKIAGNGILLMLISGIALALISLLFMKPLLYAFGATDEIMPFANTYTFIIAFGIPFQILTTGGCQLIRADGSPTYSMVCLISGAVCNTILDPILIFGLKMGIAGGALATVISQALTTIIAGYYIFKKFKSVQISPKNFRITAKYTKIICSLGAAACFNQLAMTVVQIVMNNTLKHYGALSHYGSEIPLAAVGAISKINILFLGFTIGLAQGCQPINGYNYGAKNYSRVKQTFKTALLIATIISIIAFLAFQLFSKQIIGIFGNGSEEYFEFATRYLRIFMFMTFLNGIQPVTANYFTATGKAKVGIFISLTRQIIFLLPLLIILPVYLGIDGVVYAGPIADLVTAILAWWFILREFKRLTMLETEKEMAAV